MHPGRCDLRGSSCPINATGPSILGSSSGNEKSGNNLPGYQLVATANWQREVSIRMGLAGKNQIALLKLRRSQHSPGIQSNGASYQGILGWRAGFFPPSASDAIWTRFSTPRAVRCSAGVGRDGGQRKVKDGGSCQVSSAEPVFADARYIPECQAPTLIQIRHINGNVPWLI